MKSSSQRELGEKEQSWGMRTKQLEKKEKGELGLRMKKRRRLLNSTLFIEHFIQTCSPKVLHTVKENNNNTNAYKNEKYVLSLNLVF